MRIALLGSPTSWYTADLKRAAEELGHTLFAAPFTGVASQVGGGEPASVDSAGEPLADCDAVIVRTMPPGSLEQVVFRMDALAQLESRGVRVLNPPRAIEAAVDKYLSTARLAAAGLDTPRTFACQTREAALEAFASLGGRAVLKPLFGGEGRGVTLLDDPAMAHRAFSLLEQLGAVIYLQEFIKTDAGENLACDWRLLVIGDRVLGMQRVHPTDWRTNISLGGRAEPLEVTPGLAELAQKAAATIGAPLCGVDLAPTPDGRLVVIEVNAVPGWRALGRVTGVDVGRWVVELADN